MTRTKRSQLILSLLSVAIISSCAQLATQPPQPEAVQTPPAVAKEPLNGESLFQILLAEIATNRREMGAAAALYGEISKTYNDVNAISRAAVLNQSIGNYIAMQPQAERWLELRPDDEQALAAVSIAKVANGQIVESQAFIERWLEQNADADISSLLPAGSNLDETQIEQLASVLAAVQTTYPKSSNLLYSRARLEFILGRFDQANTLNRQSIKLANNEQAQLFQFQIYVTLNDIEAAKQTIEPLFEQNPQNRQIAVQYARFIYQYDRDNTELLKNMHNRFATDPVIARTYARAAFEQGDLANAQAVFLRLLDQGFADEAHYFLGRIDVINESYASAIRHFEKVEQAPYLASALAEWVGIAGEQDGQRLINRLHEVKATQPDAAAIAWRLEASYYQLTLQNELALATFNDALVQFPKNTPLLYDRAMFYAQLEQYQPMEVDLLQILELEPNHINALNALGYTWADQGINLDTAKLYIEKALTAEPENPAFQDSKGWYLYRIGELDQAATWLEKAYAQFKNDEVAAHLAEVLWQLNRQQEARNLLAEIERLNPNSKYLDRLNALFN